MSISDVLSNYSTLSSKLGPALNRAREAEHASDLKLVEKYPDLGDRVIKKYPNIVIDKPLRELCEELCSAEGDALYAAKTIKDELTRYNPDTSADLLVSAYDFLTHSVARMTETRKVLDALRGEIADLKREFLPDDAFLREHFFTTESVMIYEQLFCSNMLTTATNLMMLLTSAKKTVKFAQVSFRLDFLPPLVPREKDTVKQASAGAAAGSQQGLLARHRIGQMPPFVPPGAPSIPQATSSGSGAAAASVHIDLTANHSAQAQTGAFFPFNRSLVQPFVPPGEASKPQATATGSGAAAASVYRPPQNSAAAAAATGSVKLVAQPRSRLHSMYTGRQEQTTAPVMHQPPGVRDLTQAMGALTLDIPSAAPSPLQPPKRLAAAAAAAARVDSGPKSANDASPPSPLPSPELVSMSAPVTAAATPLPTSSPNSGGGFTFSAAGSAGKAKRYRRQHSERLLLNASQTFAAYERLEKAVRENRLGYFPSFNDIKLLVNIEEGFQLTEAKCNVLAKLRNKLPQAGAESWKQLIQDVSQLGRVPASVARNGQRKAVVAAAMNPVTNDYPAAVTNLIAEFAADRTVIITGASGAQYELHEYDGALPVHCTQPVFADRILEHIQAAQANQETLLANRDYIMNTTPKLCASLLQSGKTHSYYSASQGKWPGVGLVVALADYETLVHAHNKDSYSPTFFKAPGVEAHTQKDSSQAVDFFNSFWMRFSVFRTFVDAIYQNVTKVYELDPVRRSMQVLKAELSLLEAPTQAVQKVIDSPYTADSVKAALSELKESLLLLTRDREVPQVQVMAGLKMGSAEELRKALDSAPKVKVASKFKPGQFVQLLRSVFPEVLPVGSAHSFEQAFEAVDAALQAQIQAAAAPKPVVVENKSALLVNLDQAISTVRLMKLEKGSAYEKWVFQQIFQRAPGANESPVDELLMISEFLAKLCAENLPKLRKAGDKEPDMTIFGQMVDPTALVAKTRLGEYNELNILTATAKAVGLGVPAFNGLVIQDYMCPDNVITTAKPEDAALVEAALKKAKALDMPIFLMRTPK